MINSCRIEKSSIRNILRQNWSTHREMVYNFICWYHESITAKFFYTENFDKRLRLLCDQFERKLCISIAFSNVVSAINSISSSYEKWSQNCVLFCSSRFPFDTNNPIGYLLAVVLQYYLTKNIILFVATVISSLVGNFFIGKAFANDMTNDLKLINDSVKVKTNRMQAIKQLCEFIEFHSTVKELSNFVIFIFYLIVFTYACSKCTDFNFKIRLYLKIVKNLLAFILSLCKIDTVLVFISFYSSYSLVCPLVWKGHKNLN